MKINKFLLITLILVGLVILFSAIIYTKSNLINQNNTKKEAFENYLDKMFFYKLGNYSEKVWYEKLKESIIKENILISFVNSTNLTSDEKYLLILISGNYCGPPIVYKFSTYNGSLVKAEIDDKNRGCLSSEGVFTNPYDDKNLTIITEGGDAGCKNRYFFEYSVDTNIVTLKKEMAICDGDEEWEVTEY